VLFDKSFSVCESYTKRLVCCRSRRRRRRRRRRRKVFSRLTQ